VDDLAGRMSAKPGTAAGYLPELADEAVAMCLYVATILGEYLDDLVVVGGLVPYLIVNQDDAEARHVGTGDLDLGFSIGVLSEERYRAVSERLRSRGFQAFQENGKTKRQMWHIPGRKATIDFLIGPVPHGAAPGKLQNLEHDLAAIVTEALPLAFVDFVKVELDGSTPVGERATRTVRVCGPGAFVVLKAIAFANRGENKDAYDLVYVLRNFGSEAIDSVVDHFLAVADTEVAGRAIEVLARDFASEDRHGPMRYAAFLGDPNDPGLRQDALGAVQAFLNAVRAKGVPG
jgi:hypothetical protein